MLSHRPARSAIAVNTLGKPLLGPVCLKVGAERLLKGFFIAGR
jgi:hypothetical protein